MKATITRIEGLLREAAAGVVTREEGAYFAELVLETHLRKAPRMNPLEDALNELRVWTAASRRDYTVEVDRKSILLLDFHGLAPSLKIKALHDQLEARARSFGCALLGLRNSAGIITLNPWAQGLARRDLIGVTLFNGGTRCTVPHGGALGVFGTLPVAYAVPTADQPIILDMAMTEIPFFQIKNAKASGTPLPAGTAVDRRGRPTVDPAAALGEDGVANLLPLGGGFKGYGLALLVEILTGSLVRSLLSTAQTPGWNPTEYGVLVGAIDIESFTDPKRFKEEVAAMCRSLRAQPPGEGYDSVTIPGDRGHAKAEALRRAGELDVKDEVVEGLEALAAGGADQLPPVIK